MKILLDLPEKVSEADIRGVLNGFSQATGSPEIRLVVVDPSTRKLSVGELSFGFNLLIVPMSRVSGLMLDRTDEAKNDGGIAKFFIEANAQEFTILEYLTTKLNPPF